MLNNTVFLFVDLYQILEVDERQAIVSLRLWISLSYYLPDLEWDPAKNGVTNVMLPAGSVWTPDVVLYDTADVVYHIFDRQQIYPNGLVVAGGSIVNIKLSCNFNVRLFPFDAQVSFHDFQLILLIDPNNYDFSMFHSLHFFQRLIYVKNKKKCDSANTTKTKYFKQK